MAIMVNLLPWRQQRRRRFWRFWCLLLTGSALVTGTLLFAVHRLLDIDHRALRVTQDANTGLLRQFAEHQQRLTFVRNRLMPCRFGSNRVHRRDAGSKSWLT